VAMGLPWRFGLGAWGCAMAIALAVHQQSLRGIEFVFGLGGCWGILKDSCFCCLVDVHLVCVVVAFSNLGNFRFVEFLTAES
jgi:hypothetical protein